MKVGGNASCGRQKIHHAIGIGIGERLQQNGIYDREDGGIGPDAEGECHYGGKSEARILPKLAKPEAHVTPKQHRSASSAMIPLKMLVPLDTAFDHSVAPIPKVPCWPYVGCAPD